MQNKYAPLTLTLIVGAFLSIGASLMVREWEAERARTQFARMAVQHSVILHQRLSSTLEAVESVAALYAASNDVTRDEFRRFSEVEFGEDRHALQALEWIPRVKAADRAAFEAAARKDGLKGFTFTERQAQGRMVPAGDRDEYFPVYFVEPYRGNEAALGFDLGSNPARLAALERARDSGKLVATERITLVQENAKGFGFLVFQPVYRNGTKTDTVEDRRQNLQGFALGVLRINDYAGMPASTAGGPAEKMNIFIFDQSAPAARQLLYPATAPFKTLAEIGSAGCVTIPETVGGRDWAVAHCPANGGVSLVEHWQSLFVLILGFLVTGVTAAYIRVISKQRSRAHRMSMELTQLIDTANAPIFGVDTRGHITEWNLKAAKITGYTKDEVMHCNLVNEFIADDHRASVNEVLEKALKGKETANYELPLQTKFGTQIAVLLNSTPRRDVGGNIVGVIGIGQDITERKRVETALTESEARYRDIVDNAQVLIQSVDPEERRFVFTNRAWQETLGYSPDEVPALGIADVIHPDSMDHCMKVIRDVLDGLPVAEIQATFVSKDGRNVEIEGSVICRPNAGGTRTTHAVFTDVTERNRSEQALKKSETGLANAQRIAHLGSWDWNIVTNELRWTDEIYRIFGLEPQQFGATYEAFLDSVHPDDRADVQEMLDRALDGKEPYSIDHRIVLPSGEQRVVHEQAEITFDDTGKPIRMNGTVQDITKQKRAEDQLRQAQKMEVVGQLTGGIAHDFNNYLTSILGNLQLIKEDLPEKAAEDLRELIDDACSAAEDGAQLTARLLAFSRKQELVPERCNPNDLISEFERMLKRTLGESVAFSMELEEVVPDVLVDPNQFRTALLNLCLNAQDALPNGGSVTVATDLRRIGSGDAAKTLAVDPGNYVVVSMSDTGTGIAPENLSQVIEPFFTTKEFGKGSGLGLSMIQGFVAQSGGAMEIESELGKGTTVSMLFPIAPSDAAEQPKQTIRSEELPGGPETILVVEDEPRVRRFAVRALDSLGYHVLEAENARKALDVLGEGASVDLIFSDIIMPGCMNGRQLAGVVAESHPDIKILLTTGYSKDSMEQKPQEGSVDTASVPLIRKPYSEKQLARQLRELLDAKSS